MNTCTCTRLQKPTFCSATNQTMVLDNPVPSSLLKGFSGAKILSHLLPIIGFLPALPYGNYDHKLLTFNIYGVAEFCLQIYGPDLDTTL